MGISPDGRIVFVNRETERAFGYTRAELIGEPVEILVPERFRKAHARHRGGYVANARRRPMGAGLDLVGRRRDGSEFPVEISLSPVEDDPDLRVTAVIRDVTDRRRDERRLRESERQLRLAQRVAGVGSWQTDPATGAVWWSEQLYSICGLVPGDPRASDGDWFGMVHADDRARFRAALQESLCRVEPLEIELRVVRPDGEVRIVDCRAEAVADPPGTGVRLVGTVQDITARREAQRSVEEQHAFLLAVLAQAGEAIVACDAEGKLVFVNAAARRLAGDGDAEVDLASWGTAYEADGTPLPLERWPIRRALRGETTLGQEVHLVRPDGTSYDLLVSAAPVRARDGAVIGAIVTAPEFTERKRTEQKLRQSEERYRGLVEASPDGIAIHRDGTLVYVNPACLRMLGGRRPEEVVGQPVLRFIHPDSLEQVKERIQWMVEKGEGVELVEENLLGLDGRTLDTEVIALPTTWGGKSAIQAVIRDVTERKRASRALRESERRLSTLISNLSGIVYRCRNDGRGTIEFVSEGSLAVLGLRPDDLVGESSRIYRSLIHPEDRPWVSRGIAEALEARRPFQLTYRLRHPSGELRWVWEQGRAVFPEDADRAAAVEGFIADVTDRQQALQELERARDEALAASRLKSIFLSTISHEIRTPLNVILGYTALMAEEARGRGVDEDHQEMLDGIERAGKRLVTTVHQILDYSRIEAGDFRVDPNRVDLGSVLRPVVSEYEKLARAKGLDFAWRNEVGEAKVRFDAPCLFGAVRSLLDNAVKFTIRGSVCVTLRRDAQGILLEVGDSGVGISGEYLPRLFEPFNQEITGYTRPFEGAGIGLALARRYVELNGAHLRVQSRKGEGSTFAIRFPPALEAGAEPAAEVDFAGRSGRSRPAILIVDGDDETRRRLHEILGSRFLVLSAATGSMARRQLDFYRGKIEAVLLDLSIEGSEDALSLARWLREQADWQDLPVIATTTHDSPDQRHRAIEAGCTDFLAKPLALRDVFARIRSIVGVPGERRAAAGH